MARGKKTGGGLRRGIPNRATVSAREAIARFVDGNVDRLQGWLDEIAKKEGALAAFRCFTDVVEYHVPKLHRAELHVGVTAFTGTPQTVSDPIAAAQAYAAIIRGEVPAEALRFESPALPAPIEGGLEHGEAD